MTMPSSAVNFKLAYAIATIISLGHLLTAQAQGPCGCRSSGSESQSAQMGPAPSAPSAPSASSSPSFYSSLPESGTALSDTGAVSLIEGDILLSAQQALEQQRMRSSDTQHGNGSQLQWSSFSLPSMYWPNGTLYYSLSSAFTSAEANFIASSLLELQVAVRNAVTFQRVRVGEVRDYVAVTSSGGCHSFVGRQIGAQAMSLQRSTCLEKYIVQHEFLHALGYWHEQSRSDRDRFVNIWWSFIESGKCSNFGIYGATPSPDYPSYDAGSIMHYDSFAFSCDGRTATITSKTTGTIPYQTQLTKSDLLRVHYYYGPGDNSTRSATTQVNQQSLRWLVLAGSIVTRVLISL